MDKEIVKKGYEATKQELQEEEISKVKGIIKATLKKLKDLQEQKREIEKQIKILKLDIEDFKAGRLDRVEERQKIDEEAKKVSVVVIEKEVVRECPYWYQPYRIYINDCPDGTAPIYCDNSYTITSSSAKDFTTGTYSISGEIVNLR